MVASRALLKNARNNTTYNQRGARGVCRRHLIQKIAAHDGVQYEIHAIVRCYPSRCLAYRFMRICPRPPEQCAISGRSPRDGVMPIPAAPPRVAPSIFPVVCVCVCVSAFSGFSESPRLVPISGAVTTVGSVSSSSSEVLGRVCAAAAPPAPAPPPPPPPPHPPHQRR